MRELHQKALTITRLRQEKDANYANDELKGSHGDKR